MTSLRNGLLRLHKALLDSEKAVYERDVQRISSPGQLLGLVMDDPWFAWLRELSRLVVSIDESLDPKQPPVTADQADVLVKQARSLVTPDEGGAGFRGQYFEAMQRDPNVVLAHSDVIRLLGTLA